MQIAESGRSGVRSIELAWDRDGPRGGVPFVWGHGLSSSRASEDVFPLLDHGRLRRECDTVRYDAVGHGESSRLPEASRGSWAELARDQVALIDDLGLDKLMLGGASMGTGTALHAAPLLGDRLAKLVLVIPPTGWETRAAQVDMYTKMASVIDTHGIEPIVAAARTMPPPDPFVESGDWVEHRVRSLEAADLERYAENLRGAAHANLPSFDELEQIAVPTLIVAWTGDPGHPADTAETLHRVMPSTELVISSTESELETWSDRIAAFLAA